MGMVKAFCNVRPVNILAKTVFWTTLLYLPLTDLAQMAVQVPITLSST